MIQNVFQKNICKQNHMGSLNEEETGAGELSAKEEKLEEWEAF